MRQLGEHYEGDVRVRWTHDGEGRVHVERAQDVEPVLDRIAAMNADGIKTIDGLGKPIGEVPVTVAMEYCAARGIPWEKFCYSNDYDAEWPRLMQYYTKLRFEAQARFHPVA